MQVKDIMCDDFKIIKPDTTLKEAAQMMRDCDCGYLPVGENDKLTGAVTDRDIVIRGVAEGHDPNDAMVKDVMTGKVIYCFEEDEVQNAGKRMKEEQIRRLVVLNKDKRMTGVVTLGDIARACNDNHMTGDIERGVVQAA